MADLSPPMSEGQDDTLQSKSSSGRKRKRRSSATGQSTGEEDHGEDNGARPPPKRACNECRQQKLRCDVEPEPFKRCSRCQRLKLECRIDANFKRVGKRSKNAEMEREIVELRKQLAKQIPSKNTGELETPPGSYLNHSSSTNNTASIHQELAGSLLDLRNSTAGVSGEKPKNKMLGDLSISPTKVEELFRDYFQFYHPWLPVLDAEKTSDHYFELSPLLFWSIITIASRRCDDDPTLFSALSRRLPPLIWETISSVPQNYHVVKALALQCTWPLPAKSTSSDPTFMLSGLMMQIALQTGLHRPSHVQEFSRIRIELREEDVRDRLRTWATCNIVTQNVSTSFGQPPKSLYDWTLTSLSEPDQDNSVPSELFWRLQVERFVNKVSQKFYNNRSSPIGITGDQERAAWTSLLVEDYRDLERQISRHGSAIDALHLQAAGLHLRLSAFFDSSTAPNYINDLLELYFTTKSFLQAALSFNPSFDNNKPLTVMSDGSPRIKSGIPDASNPTLRYVPMYFMHMILAGGFTLMKLLNSSFFPRHIDGTEARTLFNTTIRAVRAISVTNNDLPARLAEVLAQLWRSFGGAENGLNNTTGIDNSLQLKVRCRMSMSLLFDSIWRWREENQFGKSGDGTTASLDRAVANNPTNPDDLAYNTVNINNNNNNNNNNHQNNGVPTMPNIINNANDSNMQNLSSSDPSTSTTLFANPNAFPTPGSLIDRATDSGGSNTLTNMNLSAPSTVGPYPTGGGNGDVGFSSIPAGPTGMGIADYNYEVFDPLTWMLDGSIDFPYINDDGGQANNGGDEIIGRSSAGVTGLYGSN